MIGRSIARLGRWLAVMLVLLGASLTVTASALMAQVRPDSTRKDSVRVVVPVPDRLRDSLRADSLRRAPATGARSGTSPVIPDTILKAREQARIDSLYAARMRDTIKSPIAQFETPALHEVTDRYALTREEILSSGAENLTDLLDRVPGVSSFRSGWLGGVHAASFQGDFQRIRYFLDGVELDALQPRESGVLDLTDLPLWTLDALVIERSAGEVRVWMRSWSTTRTTPYTRADIFTGDLNTNGFRALFARRYRNGVILQFGGQQSATQTGRVSQFSAGSTQRAAGDGSQQTVNFRLGWTRGLLSIDALANASTRDRDPQEAREDFTSLAAFKGSRREVYFRVGYGDTASGLWSQAIINVLRTRVEGIRDSTLLAAQDTMSADTVRGRTQQILALGYRARTWQLSALDRIRAIEGQAFHAPAARAALNTNRLGVGAYLEYNTADSTRRAELSGRVLPLPWLAITGSAADRQPIDDSTRSGSRALRLEGAVRWRRAWFGGGVVRTDATTYDSPVILGTGGFRLFARQATGITANVRGPLYKDLRLDLGVVQWNATEFGRPKLQVHTELALVSNWLRKFPKGQFGIDVRVIHDLRDPVLFFYGVKSEDELDVRATERTQTFTGQLQIRIQRASIFYQYRNLTGTAYEQIPGLTMPPAVQMYGVRWEFFN